MLNGEFVIVKNLGGTAVDMSGWTLRNRRWTYTFGGFSLEAGAKVTMHTGEGTDTAKQLYLNARRFIWDDRHDIGRLRDADGLLVDSCNYRKRPGGGPVFMC